MGSPRFKSLKAIRQHSELHPPYREGDFAAIDAWTKETKAYLAAKKTSRTKPQN